MSMIILKHNTKDNISNIISERKIMHIIEERDR